MGSKEGRERGTGGGSWERQLASCLEHPAARGKASTLGEQTTENRTELGAPTSSRGSMEADEPSQHSVPIVETTGFSNKQIRDMMNVVFDGRPTKLSWDTCPVCCSDNVLDGEMFCARCWTAYHSMLVNSSYDTQDVRVLVRFVTSGARLYERRAILKDFIESITER